MPTLRDLVSVLQHREGVDAVVVVGRDGLLIDGASAPHHDAEALAAMVPPIVASAVELGTVCRSGTFATTVLEFELGTVVLSAISPDAYLMVLLHDPAHLPPLLYELRRHRTQIALLV